MCGVRRRDDILKHVTLSVPRGEITCVVGPNGAGKSTVMKTISGLLRPRQGEIRFAGEVVSGLSPKQVLARGIAQIPQAHSLFPDMTVQENVEMGAYSLSDKASCVSAWRRCRSSTRSSVTEPTTRPAASPAASSGWSSSRAA